MCLFEWECAYMCTNTCTASASGKPALAVKTRSFKHTFYYVILVLYFLYFYLWPSFYLPPSNSTSQPSASLSSSHLSLLATLFGFLCIIYLSTMLWCLTYNFNLSNRIESTECDLITVLFLGSILDQCYAFSAIPEPETRNILLVARILYNNFRWKAQSLKFAYWSWYNPELQSGHNPG